MIQIKVSNTFNNHNLQQLLLKNDTTINETILNYGTQLYNNQINILKNQDINQSIDQQIQINTIKFNQNIQITFDQ